jgi:carboxymethylenebutenolidase
MLVKQSYRDVETTANGVKGTMRVIIIAPNVPEYPDAKFPGCVVFSEVRAGRTVVLVFPGWLI